jgi:DNA-binding NtrC family response regulator
MSDQIVVQVGESLAAVEERFILATLLTCRGNKRRAAQMLGIAVKTLYNKLHSYGWTADLEDQNDRRAVG